MARRQAITWTIADLLSIETLGTNFSETLIELQTFFIDENAFGDFVCKRRPFYLRLKLC